MKSTSRRAPFFSVVTLSTLGIFISVSGCSLHIRPGNAMFDKVAGKGPLIVKTGDLTDPSGQYLAEHVGASATLRHLVNERGAPEAISVEREFLQPTRLRLFYPRDGQVYIFTRQDEEWFVSGAEPVSTDETAALQKQRSNGERVIVEPKTPVVDSRPVVRLTSSDDFRGRLKPPLLAGEASLTRDKGNNYAHSVSFAGETLAILADWYTDDANNAALLASASRRDPRAPLSIGERIIIPRTLMRNPSPLPEAFVP